MRVTLLSVELLLIALVRIVDNVVILLISFDNTITGDNLSISSDEAGDSATLLTLNRQFIADIAQGRMLANNSGYTPPVGYTIADCNDDLLDIVDVIAFNIKHGGNAVSYTHLTLPTILLV